MDYSALRFWFDVAQVIVTIAIGIYVWFVNRKKAVEKRFEQIEAAFEKRCQSRQKRIETLEKEEQALRLQIGHLPNHQDIKEMNRRLDNMQSSISEVNGRLEGINGAVDLMNEYLINNGGKDKS